jgi:hypothetical protein
MAEATVIGVVLRTDVRGWTGAPPKLPKEPVKVEEGRDGSLSFFYNLTPDDPAMTTESLGLWLGSRLERMLLSEKSPFHGIESPRRYSLDVGLMFDPEAESVVTLWSPEFMGVLGDAGIEMTVTQYPFRAQSSEPLSEDDL